MQEKETHKTPKRRFRRVISILLFVALNVTVIALTAANEFGNSREAAELSEVRVNWWLLIPAALCFTIAMILEIFKYVLMIRRMSQENKLSRREQWKLARRTVILGRYYDNITPAAVGGQPFQIYYMHKNGKLSSGLATAIPIFGMISIQISFIMLAIVCFLFGSTLQENPALTFTAWIGLLFYAFWPAMLGLATISPKTTKKIILFFVKILAKLRIVKNKEEALTKSESEINEYVKSVKMILKKRGLFIQIILISLAFNLLMAFIPYFVLTAFGGNVNFLTCFTLTIAVMSAVYFVPTPGNAGAAEGTFYLVFSALSSGYVFWAMLFWRFFSYYIYIIMGPITYLSMHVEKRRKKSTTRAD